MDNSLERKNRIEQALSMRGLKAVDLVNKAGVSKSSLSHWIKQDWQPKQKALYAMAKVLEVSELWLAGYDVPKERPVEQQNTDKLVSLIHRLRSDKDLFNVCNDMSELTADQLVVIQSLVNQLKK